jgi:hypothetical protein
MGSLLATDETPSNAVTRRAVKPADALPFRRYFGYQQDVAAFSPTDYILRRAATPVLVVQTPQ